MLQENRTDSAIVAQLDNKIPEKVRHDFAINSGRMKEVAINQVDKNH